MKKKIKIVNCVVAIIGLSLTDLPAQTSYPANVCAGQNATSAGCAGFQDVFIGPNAGLNTDPLKGTGHPAHRNLFVGALAGQNASSSASTGSSYNTFLGWCAGSGTELGTPNATMTQIIGNYNTFVGFTSGRLATGSRNVLMNPGYDNAVTAPINTGNDNAYIGMNSGKDNTGGSRNSFFGMNAGQYNNTGNDNTFIGQGSGGAVANNFQTAIGSGSQANCSNCMVLGHGSTTQNYSVGIGTSNPLGNFVVDDMNTTTTGSTDIRFVDLPSSTTLTKGLVWDQSGAGTVGKISYRDDFVFKSCGSTTPTANNFPYWTGGKLSCSSPIQVSGVNIGIGMTPGTAAAGNAALAPAGTSVTTGTAIMLDVAGYVRGTVVLASSDERYKEDIKGISNALGKIKEIKGVNYMWKKTLPNNRQAGAELQSGFIAQDLEKSIPEVVYRDGNGEYSINYMGVIPYLTEAIKEQQAQLDSKDNRITELEKKMKSFEDALASCCTSYETNRTSASNLSERAMLEQNNPNPFSESTTIRYYIPSTANKATIKIYSFNGETLKSIELLSKGNGQIQFNGGELSAGTYVYNLIVDGKQVDSKWMTLTK